MVISESHGRRHDTAADAAAPPDSPTTDHLRRGVPATSHPSPAPGRRLRPDSALRGVGALVLDWDGTLADTHQARYRALSQALAPFGVLLDEDFYRARSGRPVLDLLSRLPVPVPADRVREASARLLLEHLRSGHLQPIPATLALLHQARAAGLPCAIASSASRRLVTTGLRALNLEHMFAAVITADETSYGKPAPEVFLRAAAELALPPAACLAVDDAHDGIAAARAAGMPVLTLAGTPPVLVVPPPERAVP
ncbi:HAD family hydrolase [Streptomyces fenghuangensis]